MLYESLNVSLLVLGGQRVLPSIFGPDANELESVKDIALDISEMLISERVRNRFTIQLVEYCKESPSLAETETEALDADPFAADDSLARRYAALAGVYDIFAPPHRRLVPTNEDFRLVIRYLVMKSYLLQEAGEQLTTLRRYLETVKDDLEEHPNGPSTIPVKTDPKAIDGESLGHHSSNEDKAPAKGREQFNWLATALCIVNENPNWSDARIAKEVGRHPSTLSRSDYYKAGARLARSGANSPPKGHVVDDTDTGQIDYEAYDDSTNPAERDWDD